MIRILENKNVGYYFILEAQSGQTLLKSIDFTNKDAVQKAIESLHNLSFNRNHFERKTNNTGQFFFNLNDDKANLIGTSQLYDSEMGMENGIKNLTNRIVLLKEENNL
ncbi:YegP family protein [Pseudozobellia sp. WGM2]|uniref:YegP family protein n=1 Tax=Pseudozobellia sp. WGM2 TaxID=2787625 RepID=UPI001ADECBB7